jgi:hypothetical protein
MMSVGQSFLPTRIGLRALESAIAPQYLLFYNSLAFKAHTQHIPTIRPDIASSYWLKSQRIPET